MRWFLPVLLFLPTCHHGERPWPMPHESPRVAILFHGDTDFTEGERALVGLAVDGLEAQTNGMYRLKVEYDLDFHTDAFKRWTGLPWLVRARSCYPQITVVEEWKKHPVLGITIRAHVSDPPQIYLVSDRLEDAPRFQHVVMHELLHAAGLDDLPGLNNVMSGVTYKPVTCMTQPDMLEFCRVQACRTEELRGCL